MVDVHNLTDAQKDEYSLLEAMTRTPGWTLFERWLNEKSVEAFRSAALAHSWEQNNIAKGAFYVYESLRQYQDTLDKEFQQKAEDNAQEVQTQQTEQEHLFE